MAAISGSASSVRYVRCPAPRMPISSTKNSVASSACKIVKGTPTSVLKDPTAATVRPAELSTCARRSLVLVFPLDPVMAMTLHFSLCSRTQCASAPRASTGSPTTMQGASSGRLANTAVAPLATALAAKSCPSTFAPRIATNIDPGPTCRESVATSLTSADASTWCAVPPTISAISATLMVIMSQPKFRRQMPPAIHRDHRRAGSSRQFPGLAHGLCQEPARSRHRAPVTLLG